MTLHIYRSDEPHNITLRPPRRWQLLVLDALSFYEKTPGGATAAMVAAYIRPRLGWWGRTFGCQAKVYAVMYGMVDLGWLEHLRGEPVGTHGGVRYTYRVARVLKVPNGQ